ncbi:hypothetical protein CCMA1212_000429 [Trichoderma ghanense]|uniref:Transmembrane protein n=1 Tax=Trichoderma ghanense TaxID=65468 RepID=A0ABY2HIN7_9HYPO
MASSATGFAMRNTNRHSSTRTAPHSPRLSRNITPETPAIIPPSYPCPYPYPWPTDDAQDGYHPENDGFQSEGTPYDPRAIVRVLIPVSIAGWLLFGVICILCINGRRGKAGRWIPEWYLDSEGTRRDRALVVGWWAAVIVLWPVILPMLVVGEGVRVVNGWCGALRRRRAGMLQPREGEEGDEEEV